LNELSLFSGAGGGLLGSKLLGWKTIAYVEWDDYCQEVLKARIKDGYLDDAPIFSDISTFKGKQFRGLVDVITAGFPCQPFSIAGEKKGEDDEKNKWPDTIRILREIRPKYALFENVSGLLISGYFGRILTDIHESGYDVSWDCIPSASIGAPHRRDRLWIFCTNSEGKRFLSGKNESRNIKESISKGFWRYSSRQLHSEALREEIISEFFRNDNGMASELDRLKAIGNGQVPGVVEKAWKTLVDIL